MIDKECKFYKTCSRCRNVLKSSKLLTTFRIPIGSIYGLIFLCKKCLPYLKDEKKKLLESSARIFLDKY